MFRSAGALVVLVFALTGCGTPRDPVWQHQVLDLSPREIGALRYIDETPNMRITLVERLASDLLLVTTQQGNTSQRYHINSSDLTAQGGELVSPLPESGLITAWDRHKTRGHQWSRAKPRSHQHDRR